MDANVKRALNSFQINTCSTISGTGRDAVDEILPMIHGIATLMESGFRKEADGSSLFGTMNPELVSSAFAGIGYLAALAKFHSDQG